MYKIGDKILYPPHGAGVIEDIEEKRVLGEVQSYYIMQMPSEGMTVMIPTKNCQELGVREIISCEDALLVLEKFRTEEICDDDNWNRRQRENIVKIKSGDIYKVLTVVKNLMFRDKKKGLSTSERKMLGNAKRILVSEIVMSGAASKGDVESIMADTIDELI